MTTLQLLVDYGIPINLLILMFVAGTEITACDLRSLRRNPSPVVIGAIGQLALLPILALAIVSGIKLQPAIASGLIIRSLCPGGGISNTYSYLARCNVLLSAAITTLGTVASLITIPFWLAVLPSMAVTDDLHAVPASTIIAQLLVFMLLPLSLGILLRHRTTVLVDRIALGLRRISMILVLVILVAALTTVGRELVDFAFEIAVTASAFILGAMMIGWLLAIRMKSRDAPVVVIESGVRNVGVALILGSTILSREDFGVFAGFVTGYFVVAVMIMLIYAAILASHRRDEIA